MPGLVLPCVSGAKLNVIVGRYTILQAPILCGIYCNNGGSWGHVVLRNIAGDGGVGWGTQTKGGCAKNSIDSCTKF